VIEIISNENNNTSYYFTTGAALSACTVL